MHRGSQPIFWCVLIGDLHGISIHEMDQGIDTGRLVYQRVVGYDEKETFREIYIRTRLAIADGVGVAAEKIISQRIKYSTQSDCWMKAHHHKQRDALKLIDMLPRKWDTSVKDARAILAKELELYRVRILDECRSFTL